MIETPPDPHAPRPAPRTADAASGAPPRIALAHDWLAGYRGGEAVLERVALLLGERVGALYTMFDDGRPMSPAIDRLRARGAIRATGTGTRAWALRSRRWLLPLYPRLVRSLSRRLAADHARQRFDLLLSTSSAAIKGLTPPPFVSHLCYCHGPARYIWSQRSQYTGGALGAVRGAALRAYAPRFRAWDRATAATVTRFIANSSHTAREIARCFGREATVVHPPVRTDFFTPDLAIRREPFWLLVSALEPYKRTDLAIAGAAAAGAELVIAGAGSQRARLERLGAGRARFLGRVSDEALRDLYRRARLLLFPQVEDFGIVAGEALACGTPVLARRAGGALDIVREGVTGAFFDEPTPAAIAGASHRVPEGCDASCRAAAQQFSEAAFDRAMLSIVRDTLGRPIGPSPR